jgi:RNA polymerase subunit RPABC4/transcription elongation factor Spt4
MVTFSSSPFDSNSKPFLILDAVYLGGVGLNIIQGTKGALRLGNEDLVFATTESTWGVDLESIIAIHVDGEGAFKTGGGWFGGGIGVAGALEGAALASIMNSLTTKVKIDCVFRIQCHDIDITFQILNRTPRQLRIDTTYINLAAQKKKHQVPVKNHTPHSIASQIKELAELRDLGIITLEEFQNKKTQLLVECELIRLINCKVCKSNVSTESIFCSNCGNLISDKYVSTIPSSASSSVIENAPSEPCLHGSWVINNVGEKVCHKCGHVMSNDRPMNISKISSEEATLISLNTQGEASVGQSPDTSDCSHTGWVINSTGEKVCHKCGFAFGSQAHSTNYHSSSSLNYTSPLLSTKPAIRGGSRNVSTWVLSTIVVLIIVFAIFASRSHDSNTGFLSNVDSQTLSESIDGNISSSALARLNIVGANFGNCPVVSTVLDAVDCLFPQIVGVSTANGLVTLKGVENSFQPGYGLYVTFSNLFPDPTIFQAAMDECLTLAQGYEKQGKTYADFR